MSGAAGVDAGGGAANDAGGPAKAAPAVRALNCPNCGGAIEMHAAGYSVSLICPHCGSTLDATDPALRLIEAAQAALRRPRIPIGTRGRLDEVEWEAVGYLERSAEDGGWSEYLLFNPYRGYRWLIESEGRFSLGRVLDRAPEGADEQVRIGTTVYAGDGEPYPARVDFVVGEFPWRVRVGETVSVLDYAAGTASLSRETNDAERTWTLSKRLGHGMAEAAFGIAPDPQRPAGGGSSRMGPLLKPLWMIAAIASGLLLALAAALGPTRAPLLRQDIAVTLDAPERTVVMGPITLTRARSAVTVRTTTAGLDNAWIDLDYALVDRRTQARYDAYGLAEEYHGSDADGPWQEGDAKPATSFAGIPRGTYDLVLEVSAHRWGSPTLANTGSLLGPVKTYTYSFHYGDPSPAAAPEPVAAPPPPPPATVAVRVTVRRGAAFAGNVRLALFLVLLWPGIALYRHLRSRWGGGAAAGAGA